MSKPRMPVRYTTPNKEQRREMCAPCFFVNRTTFTCRLDAVGRDEHLERFQQGICPDAQHTDLHGLVDMAIRARRRHGDGWEWQYHRDEGDRRSHGRTRTDQSPTWR